MGTWDAGPFENDAAMDYCGNIARGLETTISPSYSRTFETEARAARTFTSKRRGSRRRGSDVMGEAVQATWMTRTCRSIRSTAHFVGSVRHPESTGAMSHLVGSIRALAARREETRLTRV
jgi:hypothetical protein